MNLKCLRCGGPKIMSYLTTCDECRYEDEAAKMMRELEAFLDTGALPTMTTVDANLPRPNKSGPPPNRFHPPEEQIESA